MIKGSAFLPGVAATPDNTVVCAVGDIHGRLDVLKGVTGELRRIARDAADEHKRFVAVFLGDYIDRGPDSSGVISHLIDFSDEDLGDTVFLRGNHEQILLDVIDDEAEPAQWLDFGGLQTLQSYGVDAGAATSGKSPAEKLRQAIPPAHIAFLRHTELLAKFGDYVFVHAGLRPDRMLEEQSEADMMWFRYYADEPTVHGQTVVHGHSPNPRPINGRSRIAIDTEAYASNALTIVKLEGSRRKFLRVYASDAEPTPEVSSWDDVDASYAMRERPAAVRRPPPAPAEQAAAARPRPKPKPAATPSGVGVVLLAALAIVASIGAAGFVVWKLTGPSTRLPPLPPSPATYQREDATPGIALSQPAPAVAAPVIAQPIAEASLAPAAAKAPDLAASTPAPTPAPAPAPAPTPSPKTPAAVAATPAAPPAPASAQASSASGPIRVQIGALPTVALAQDAWGNVMRAFPRQTTSKTLQVEPTDANGSTLYRATIVGFESADAARAFCDELRAASRPCMVKTAQAAGQPLR